MTEEVPRITRWGLNLMHARARQTLEWCNSMHILEIGPGRGVLAREALWYGDMNYWAVDCDQAVLDTLPNRAHKVLGTAPLLPLPPGVAPFDAVVAEAVIEHMAGYNEAVEFVRCCRYALVPGGRLVLRFPDWKYCRERFWEVAVDHQYVTNMPRVVTLLEQNGFEIIKAGHFVECWTGWKAFVVWYATRLIPARLMHWLTGGGYSKTTWSKLLDKYPQGYVVAQRYR